jgi:hypothetical protein
MIPFPKSKRGADRQFRALLSKYRRDFAGGFTFGMDWPTLHANAPDVYNRLMALRLNYKDLPE